MNELLTFNLAELIHGELQSGARPNDSRLHASSHIMGSLRHAQLAVAGAPTLGRGLLNEITLMTGTMWHTWLHDTLRKNGVPYMAETNLTPWLPEGWAGTCDALFWRPDLKAFVLVDFKTTKGESLRYIRKDGAKDEHIAQASAYWYAAKAMGIPLAKAIGVLYLPKNDTRNRDELIEPLLVDFKPLPQKALHDEMARRWGRVSEYTTALTSVEDPSVRPLADWVNDALEPEQERVQRIFLDRATGTHDVKLMPHWSTEYCPYPNDLCACSEQGQTKIGMFDTDGEYIPRPGFEKIKPKVRPT